MSLLVFLAIAVTIVGLIHLYLWQRLVRDPLPPGRWRRAGGFVVLAGAVLIVATMAVEPELPRPFNYWLAWPGFVWLGVMFYLLVALLAVELPVLAAWLVLRWRERRRPAPAPTATPAPAPAPAPAPVAAASPSPAPAAASAPAARGVSRRRVLRQAGALTAGAAALGISGYGISRAYQAPRVRRVTVPLARLDPRADGLRVAVVGDLHASPLFGAGQVRRVVEIVNALDADLVTIVGDTVSGDVAQVRSSVAPLADLRSRYGAFFVTGNHEYYTGYEEWMAAAGELGLRMLRNERVEITHGGGAIDLAGVNDREGENYGDPADYEAALGDRDPTRPVLLLAHQPVQVHRAAAYDVDLQLSGHTHGGQLYPFDYLVKLEQPVVSGLAEVDGTKLYVTNGAGFWGPPMRVGADPDVTLLDLHAP